MSRRIAHRPRYRHLPQQVQTPLRTRQRFFNAHWTYRRQGIDFEKHPFGYRLSLLPWGYRWPFTRNILAS